MKPVNKDIQAKAKGLCFNQTAAEQLLWTHLRNRQLNNLKFRRQHPIGFYIADYYCAEVKLVVEIDGDTHLDQAEYDQKRTHWLEEQGLRVMRFTNEVVLDTPEAVLELITEYCASRVGPLT